MKYIMATILLLASTGSLADKPDGLPGDNGNHYAYGKEGNNGMNGNHYGNSQEIAAIPEASTLAMIGLGLAGLIITRRRKK